MTPETIRRLDSLFASAPILVGKGPVPRDEVDHAEASVGMKFDPDYREFVERYGGAMVGSLPILGVRQAEVMGTDTYSVSHVTAQFRSDGWPHTEQWVVISVDLERRAVKTMRLAEAIDKLSQLDDYGTMCARRP